MNSTQLDYTYKTAHFPNTVSWYRELVYLEGKLIGEINEPTDSTSANKIYKVCKYVPLQVTDGTVDILSEVSRFGRVCDCKDYINNGGIL
jgi:hypothetical protein